MDNPMYQSGLRFECGRCSSCCRGEPGYVFLQETDLERLCRRFGLSREGFLEKFCVIVDFGIERLYSLKEKKNHDCILWLDGCSAYEDRPVQCGTYPFWSSILESEESWEEEKAHCPGIGKGRLYSKDEIEERLYARRAVKPVGPA